ncbi:hypothetical protein Y032_0094g2770 [Ancylostoma ceylanicum]|uniref:Uncharacterized protein n=1 Tax=Ancylostoma ceylanicum TaxID=53326 RepID=A0A016TLL2_9BILA|nr:hypothetical protein Y032_0094g2770 [Ancylostoma ceylanicum]
MLYPSGSSGQKLDDSLGGHLLRSYPGQLDGKDATKVKQGVVHSEKFRRRAQQPRASSIRRLAVAVCTVGPFLLTASSFVHLNACAIIDLP